MAEGKSLRMRLVGVNLPGMRFRDSDYSSRVYEPVHLAVQRGREFEQVVPADVGKAVFEFDVRLAGVDPDDVRGPYVQGRKGDRFFYLSWVIPTVHGYEIMRRAKLRPSRIPASVWNDAVETSGVLEGTLSLTDSKGGPLCASVDERCRWRVIPP